MLVKSNNRVSNHWTSHVFMPNQTARLIFSSCIKCILRWNLATAEASFGFLSVRLIGTIAYLFVTCLLEPIFRIVIGVTMVPINIKPKIWRLKWFSFTIIMPVPMFKHFNFDESGIDIKNGKIPRNEGNSVNFFEFFYNNTLIIAYFNPMKPKPIFMF